LVRRPLIAATGSVEWGRNPGLETRIAQNACRRVRENTAAADNIILGIVLGESDVQG